METEMKNLAWFLILDNNSSLGKSSGAYKLNTIKEYREMNVLPRFSKY